MELNENAECPVDTMKRKRLNSEDSKTIPEIELGGILATPTQSRPRITLNKESKSDTLIRIDKISCKTKDRWRTHSMIDEYVNTVGGLVYPKICYGSFGYNAEKGKYPVSKHTTLGFFCSLRRQATFESWSPLEVAKFEASITLYGKNFNIIQKHVKTKTVKEIIQFYYDWKKTSHYKLWKKAYVAEERDES